MDRLMEILNKKQIPGILKNIIVFLYDEVVKFYGIDKEDLILETIKQFKFIGVDDLGDKLVQVQNGKTNDNGVGRSNVGLCVVKPIIKNKQIVDVDRFILYEENIDYRRLTLVILHELFFHGIKSMNQPYMSDNILMIGLNGQKYYFSDNDNIVNIERYVGHGLEEISTYYGQIKVFNNFSDNDVLTKFGDEILLDIVDSFGKIMDDTSLGKLILDAQISKDVSELEQVFDEIEDNRILLTKDKDKITWNDYNRLLDEFMKYHYIALSLLPDDSDYGIKLTKYLRTYFELNKLNMDILFATLLLDSNNVKKRKR